MCCHKFLALGSRAEYESSRCGTCFAMNPDWHISWSKCHQCFSLSQADTPAWHCSHGNRKRTALRACSSSGLENVSSLRLVFLPSSEDPGSWDPAAVQPSTCPGKGQDLAEPETLESGGRTTNCHQNEPTSEGHGSHSRLMHGVSKGTTVALAGQPCAASPRLVASSPRSDSCRSSATSSCCTACSVDVFA